MCSLIRNEIYTQYKHNRRCQQSLKGASVIPITESPYLDPDNNPPFFSVYGGNLLTPIAKKGGRICRENAGQLPVAATRRATCLGELNWPIIVSPYRLQ